MAKHKWSSSRVALSLSGDKTRARRLKRKARTFIGYLFDQLMPGQTYRTQNWRLKDGSTVKATVWRDVLGERAAAKIFGAGASPAPEDGLTIVVFFRVTMPDGTRTHHAIRFDRTGNTKPDDGLGLQCGNYFVAGSSAGDPVTAGVSSYPTGRSRLSGSGTELYKGGTLLFSLTSSTWGVATIGGFFVTFDLPEKTFFEDSVTHGADIPYTVYSGLGEVLSTGTLHINFGLLIDPSLTVGYTQSIQFIVLDGVATGIGYISGTNGTYSHSAIGEFVVSASVVNDDVVVSLDSYTPSATVSAFTDIGTTYDSYVKQPEDLDCSGYYEWGGGWIGHAQNAGGSEIVATYDGAVFYDVIRLEDGDLGREYSHNTFTQTGITYGATITLGVWPNVTGTFSPYPGELFVGVMWRHGDWFDQFPIIWNKHGYYREDKDSWSKLTSGASSNDANTKYKSQYTLGDDSTIQLVYAETDYAQTYATGSKGAFQEWFSHYDQEPLWTKYIQHNPYIEITHEARQGYSVTESVQKIGSVGSTSLPPVGGEILYGGSTFWRTEKRVKTWYGSRPWPLTEDTYTYDTADYYEHSGEYTTITSVQADPLYNAALYAKHTYVTGESTGAIILNAGSGEINLSGTVPVENMSAYGGNGAMPLPYVSDAYWYFGSSGVLNNLAGLFGSDTLGSTHMWMGSLPPTIMPVLFASGGWLPTSTGGGSSENFARSVVGFGREAQTFSENVVKYFSKSNLLESLGLDGSIGEVSFEGLSAYLPAGGTSYGDADVSHMREISSY